MNDDVMLTPIRYADHVTILDNAKNTYIDVMQKRLIELQEDKKRARNQMILLKAVSFM